MRIKIFKRGPTCINASFLPLMSLIITYILVSMAKGVSALNIFNINLDKNIYLIIILAIITTMAIHYALKISKIFLLFFILIVSYYNFFAFFTSFNKLVLVFSFLYTIFSIFMCYIWIEELDDVIYNPGFTVDDIFFKNSLLFQIELVQNNTRVNGLITNMGENGFFAITDHNIDLSNRNIVVKISFAGQTFTQQGVIITQFGPGFGIKLLPQKADFTHSWHDFYSIIVDRKLAPLS